MENRCLPIRRLAIKLLVITINKNGYLQFKATNVGNHTMLSSIIEMVKRARMSKAPIQRIANRAIQYFIPIILLSPSHRHFIGFL